MTRQQLGVTDAMLETFGELVFRLSHNLQVREGDPVRRLDWSEIERQREGMGLSDAQIAARLGLTRDQVMFIRNSEESRRFRTGQTAYLLDLGGGRRFRSERVVPLEQRFSYSEDALRLRAALRYDPQRALLYAERGWWGDDTLPQWLARHVKERGDAIAVVTGEESLSWKALNEKVLRFAEGLRRAGVAQGEVVAVQLPNTLEFVVAFLAICRLGAVMCTLHMPYRGAEIAALMRHSRAKLALCIPPNRDMFEGKGRTFAELECAEPLAKEAPLPVAADPFLLLYTSGTTAAPKGVPLSYHAMLSNARLSAPEHRLTAADRCLSAAPFTHLFGLYSLHCAWAVGACTVLLPAFKPDDLSVLIQEAKPTALWTAPAHIAAMRAMGLFDKHDWSSLKLAIMSGSACPPALVSYFQDKAPGCAVTQLWGMTEMQAGLYTRPGDAAQVHRTSAGRPSPGTEIRLAEDGELQVRGCLLFPGYYDNDEANRDAFTADGWFRTGDLAALDAAGNVSITGRSKDIINRGGVKFNPREVEDLLCVHPRILQAAIVPMPDPVLGEKACAFVVTREKQSVTLEELVAYLLEKKIAKIKLPERLVIVDDMPLTPTRKIIKGKLRIP